MVDDSLLRENVTVENVDNIRARAVLTNNQEDNEPLMKPINNDPPTVKSFY